MSTCAKRRTFSTTEEYQKESNKKSIMTVELIQKHRALLVLAVMSITLTWAEVVGIDSKLPLMCISPNVLYNYVFAVAITKSEPSKRQTEVMEDASIPEYIEILRGRDGRDGLNGEPGLSGRDGFKGEKGCRGMIGPIGPTGSTGAKGEIGSHGPAGSTGEIGPIGPTGSTGTKGEIGSHGPAGSTGAKGEIGPIGPTGSTGAKGEIGSHGPAGENGEQGIDGIPGQKGEQGPYTGGVTYVRWGRSICPNITGTELVYAGRAGGSYYTHSGGGANYQCLPEEPENLEFGSGTQTGSYMYGAEYQVNVGNNPSTTNDLHDHDVPCAVCYVATRIAILMIPGKYTCPQNWTQDYYGYLMAERNSDHRSTFECFDVAPETATGGEANNDGARFFHVEPRCGSLPCPPYEEEKEMTCAVCTR